MTTGCVEYWFMLHYKMSTPSLKTKAEKDRMIADLKRKEPRYKKGDKNSTERIAVRYPVALDNGPKTLAKLLAEGLPGII